MNRIDLDGRRAVVTGGAQGIGRAVAERLLASGASVALWDQDAGLAEQTAAQLGRAAHAVAVDVTDAASVDAAVWSTADRLGGIDILVANAGISGPNLKVWEYPPEEWRRVLEIDLTGVFLCCRAVVPGMIARNYGRIVCTASIAGKEGNPNASAYSAAKAGVIALVKSVAQEEGKNGITLNVVSPGATNTPLRQEREAGLRAQMGEEKYAKRVNTVLKMYPAGRIGEPQDIAATITFLLSPRASWITGQVVSVNGGFVMP